MFVRSLRLVMRAIFRICGYESQSGLHIVLKSWLHPCSSTKISREKVPREACGEKNNSQLQCMTILLLASTQASSPFQLN